MNEKDYNARLYEKMKAEQDKYRDWLLHQEPSEILNHTYEYTMREDIVMCMEELELEPEKARALLRSPCPLSDVYKEFRDRETEHKLSAYTCICCGKPATRITLGWISPFCDDCVPKGKNGETTGYYESMPIWSHGR